MKCPQANLHNETEEIITTTINQHFFNKWIFIGFDSTSKSFRMKCNMFHISRCGISFLIVIRCIVYYFWFFCFVLVFVVMRLHGTTDIWIRFSRQPFFSFFFFISFDFILIPIHYDFLWSAGSVESKKLLPYFEFIKLTVYDYSVEFWVFVLCWSIVINFRLLYRRYLNLKIVSFCSQIN